MNKSGQYFQFLAFDSSGRPVSRKDLRDALVLDLEYLPPFEHRPLAHDGHCFLPAPDGPFAVGVPLEVDGFGEVWLYADNEGKGYTAASCATPINFPLEAARSRLSAVARTEERYCGQGFSFSADYVARMDKARSLLAEAAGLSTDVVQVSRLAMASLCQSLHAGEMLVLEHARAAIKTMAHRRNFRFGAYPGGGFGRLGPEYNRLFSQLLNYVTVPFYRGRVEAREGTRDYRPIDAMLEWAKRDGLVPKGHTFIFLGAGPSWFKGRSYEAVKESCRDYILDAVGRYKNDIKIWDAINEAHDWSNPNGFSQEQLTDLTRLAADTTRQADPDAIRIVNCCGTWGEYVAAGQYYNYEFGRPTRTPLAYLRDVIAAGIDFEVIGLQLYYPARDMFEISRHLDMHCALGKTVHITELGVSSADDVLVAKNTVQVPSRQRWHGRPWSEHEQADWIEDFYTLCYAKPGIEAISWWDFSDPGFIPHGGLVDAQLRPKEAYHRLRDLIGSWR